MVPCAVSRSRAGLDGFSGPATPERPVTQFRRGLPLQATSICGSICGFAVRRVAGSNALTPGGRRRTNGTLPGEIPSRLTLQTFRTLT